MHLQLCCTMSHNAAKIRAESYGFLYILGYGLEIDMWALGVITYILLCGFPPFRSAERKQTELFECIKAGEFEFLLPYWDKSSEGRLLFLINVLFPLLASCHCF